MKQSCWTSRSFPVRARQIRVDPERSDHLSCNRFFWKRALLHESMAQTSHKEQFPSPKGGGPIEARNLQCVCPSFLAVSIRRKAVAPLKLRDGLRVALGTRGFHRRKAVAPLKRSLNGMVYMERQRPRFHRRKAVAPLKLLKKVAINLSAHALTWFPSPKGGGPIEAPMRSRRLFKRPGPGRFHRRKAVAPLKPA